MPRKPIASRTGSQNQDDDDNLHENTASFLLVVSHLGVDIIQLINLLFDGLGQAIKFEQFGGLPMNPSERVIPEEIERITNITGGFAGLDRQHLDGVGRSFE